MAIAVYLLGILVTLACAVLLLRGYARGKKRLLLWSGLCFVGLTLNNVLIFVDLILVPQMDLYLYRLVTASVAMGFMLYGLIWESR